MQSNPIQSKPKPNPHPHTSKSVEDVVLWFIKKTTGRFGGGDLCHRPGVVCAMNAG